MESEEISTGGCLDDMPSKVASKSLLDAQQVKNSPIGSFLSKIISDENIPRPRSLSNMLHNKSSTSITKLKKPSESSSRVDIQNGSDPTTVDLNYPVPVSIEATPVIAASYTLPESIYLAPRASSLNIKRRSNVGGDAETSSNSDVKDKSCPMVRTKSSFFIYMSNSVLESRMKSTASIISNSKSGSSAQLPTRDNTISTAPTLLAPTSEDCYLKDIESKGFLGIWNNAITRLYFLQFLIWNRQENLLVLRMEILDYRNSFHKLAPNMQIAAAKRIRKFFLLSNSVFRIDWPETTSVGFELKPEDAVDRVNQNLENPEANTFDLIGHLALLYLEKSFNGELTSDADSPSGTRPSVGFQKSPFFQTMQNDLRGTIFLTANQYKRAAERVLCFLESKVTDSLSYEKIISVLEPLCLDQELIKKYEKKMPLPAATSPVKGGDENGLFSPSFVSPSVLSPSTIFVGAPTKYEISTANHAFLAAHGEHPPAYCEYCFEVSNSVEETKLYSCETCGVFIHKSCRAYMTLSCEKTSFEGGKGENMDVGSEAMRIVADKLAALQKEIDIELQIREGLEKIVKAKKPSKAGTKKTPFEVDIAAQLEKNTKRLDGLKHEMQKRTLQLQSMQAATAAAAPQILEESVESSVQDDLDRPKSVLKKSLLTKSMGTINSSMHEGDSIEMGLLRVVVIDPATKAQFTKAVYITENQSTLEVIDVILNKSNLNGIPMEFTLSYKDPSQVEPIVLKDEDRPTQIEYLNYANTLFYLQARKPVLSLPTKSSHSASENGDPQIKKQLDIVNEIIESEAKYSEDLKLINSIFIEPLAGTDIISDADAKELFININDISPIHEKICFEISRPYPKAEDKISKLINCYLDNLDQFFIYQEYCGSQYQQREIYKRLSAQNMPFTKFIQKCEQHPKLHKLGLLDMLMKPMQKVTRYPLLFKRLLPNMTPGTDDFDSLTILINSLEQAIFKLNETVRHMESRFRIRLIDKTLDFGLVADKFKIAIDDRQLLMENNLFYINQKADTLIEVVVFLFNDMLLIARRSKKVLGGYILYKPPIPLEQVVFLDQSADESKKWFQIAHLKQDIHTLQAYSVFDKKSWLQEAEAVKDTYVETYTKFEHGFMKMQCLRFMKNFLSMTASSNHLHPSFRNSPITFPDDSYQGSYLGAFFFKSTAKKQTDDSASFVSIEETSQSAGTAKSKSQTPNIMQSVPEAPLVPKLSSDELLQGKKKLSGSYIRRESIKAMPDTPKVSSDDLLSGRKNLRTSLFRRKEKEESPIAANPSMIPLSEGDEAELKSTNMERELSQSNASINGTPKGSNSNLLKRLRTKVMQSIKSNKKKIGDD